MRALHIMRSSQVNGLADHSPLETYIKIRLDALRMDAFGKNNETSLKAMAQKHLPRCLLVFVRYLNNGFVFQNRFLFTSTRSAVDVLYEVPIGG